MNADVISAIQQSLAPQIVDEADPFLVLRELRENTANTAVGHAVIEDGILVYGQQWQDDIGGFRGFSFLIRRPVWT
jgi:hypothetical protein